MTTSAEDSRWFPGVLLLGLIMSIVVQATRPMATYRTLELGGGYVEIGVVAASFALVSVPLALPIGRWIDRVGERVLISAGMAIMAGSAVAAMVAPSIPVLVAAAAGLGLGHVGLAVSLQAIVANRSRDSESDSRFGHFSVFQSLGQLVGPLGAGLLAANDGGTPRTELVFAACASISVLGVVVSLFLWRADHHAAKATAPPPMANSETTPALSRVMAVPGMPRAMLTGIVVLVAINVVIAYLPAYGTEIGLSVQVVGALLAVRAGASMASRLLLGTLRSRMTRQSLLVLCMLTPAIALSMVPLVTTIPLLMIAMAFTGAGLGLGQPLTLAWVAMQAPRDLRGTAMAARMAGARIGQVVVPGMAGGIAALAGSTAVFWSLGLVLAASAAIIRFGEAFSDDGRRRVKESSGPQCPGRDRQRACTRPSSSTVVGRGGRSSRSSWRPPPGSTSGTPPPP